MGYHSVNDTTVERLREFINMLNEESENGSVIVVEAILHRFSHSMETSLYSTISKE